MIRSYTRASAGPAAFLALVVVPAVIERMRGNYDAQHLFNLLALVLAVGRLLYNMRDEPWRPAVGIATAMGTGYGIYVVLIGQWVGRDDRMSNLGVIIFAAGTALAQAALYRGMVWQRVRRANRHAPLANDR